MAFIIGVLGIGALLIGLFSFLEKMELLRLKGEKHTEMPRKERIVFSLVSLFVGMVLCLTSYSSFIGQPTWFLDHVFMFFT